MEVWWKIPGAVDGVDFSGFIRAAEHIAAGIAMLCKSGCPIPVLRAHPGGGRGFVMVAGAQGPAIAVASPLMLFLVPPSFPPSPPASPCFVMGCKAPSDDWLVDFDPYDTHPFFDTDHLTYSITP